MKKAIMLTIILSMVLITTQIQATCTDNSPMVYCSVNTTTTDGSRFYMPVNQSLSVMGHTVWSGSGTSLSSATCDGWNFFDTVADSSNPSVYNFGSLTATFGYVDLYVSTQTVGYAYVQATW